MAVGYILPWLIKESECDFSSHGVLECPDAELYVDLECEEWNERMKDLKEETNDDVSMVCLLVFQRIDCLVLECFG